MLCLRQEYEGNEAKEAICAEEPIGDSSFMCESLQRVARSLSSLTHSSRRSSKPSLVSAHTLVTYDMHWRLRVGSRHGKLVGVRVLMGGMSVA